MAKVIPVSLVAVYRPEDSSIWMQQRFAPENPHLHLKWELPGGKLEKGETPLEAAQREFREEIGPRIALGDLNLFKIHPYELSPHEWNSFFIFHTKLKKNYLPSLKEGLWFNSVDSKLFPPANVYFIKELLEYLSVSQKN